jgi:hypothetical protein
MINGQMVNISKQTATPRTTTTFWPPTEGTTPIFILLSRTTSGQRLVPTSASSMTRIPFPRNRVLERSKVRTISCTLKVLD